MKFIDISGFEKEKNFLINAENKNHVAHAQLFFGSEGSPNLSLALAFISFLNCNNKINNDSCGECPSCKKINKMIHPDVHFIFPVAPTTKINKNVISDLFIKEWRNFILDDPYQNVNDWFSFYGFENKSPNISKDESRNLIKKLTLKPFESENKIVLIWLPEYLHLYTSNALLKILEDPPPKTFFFLITNDYNRLLKTILSRVQMFKIRNFSDEELKKEILKKEDIAENELSKLILTSDGNLNQAKKIINSSNEDFLSFFKIWMRNCYSNDYAKIQLDLEWFNNQTKINKKAFLIYSLNLIRESFVIKINSSLSRIVDEESEFIKNFSQSLNEEKTEKIILELNDSIRFLERNANPKIIFLDLSIEIANAFNEMKQIA
tara:strand:- start:2650 stop:3783 length:1134 start_codon:yes stop_codon:yes gene_type:complete